MAEAAAFTNEDKYQLQLEETRAKARMGKDERKRKLPRIRGRLPAHVGIVEAFLMLGFVGVADILDFLIIGSIPVLGDIIDAAVWMTVWLWMMLRPVRKPTGTQYAGIIEFIPFFGDWPPTWFAMVLVSVLYNNHLRSKLLKKRVSALSILKKTKKT